ncbi:asparaginase [Pseudoflavonifractor phocaeensis]|uniref:asparaginase n=1 Tax=Pseudoflavonifractor phocaeensis TaxID=1870988 RepID=UPI001F37514D|nr:asparaginase [Pseudoflavonifractor phocaeensis]MCF2661441.1 asparaginase [Pseudoflavonifractor phocaeensis]
MRRILMLATGGTIASKESGHGLSPAITSEEILGYVPAVGELCSVDAVQLMNLDSTNIGPSHWLEMAAAIRARYDQYDGFVLTHGTDTMAYTAAALSYLIQDSPKPIVITGSQKSICLHDTDARMNLYNSFLYACDRDSHDVSLVFDGKVILGTRARKERTKSFNAFSSVDYPEIAVIRDGRLIRYLAPTAYSYGAEPVFYDRLEDRVLLLTLIPGMGAEALRRLRDSYQAVILQSFGVGGLPGGSGGALAQAMGEWMEAGKTIVMMTQVPYEGSDMSVYQVGQQVKEKYQLMEAYNMTLEAAATKLMWALGQTSRPEEVRELFYRPVQHDVIC